MKVALNHKMLVCWLIGNAVVTICFGLFLAVICLFPTCAPRLNKLFAEGTLANFLPYVIFILIVSALVSLSFYYDSRNR